MRYIIYVDILGTENRAIREAEIIGRQVDDIRESLIASIEKRIEQIKKEGVIIDFKQISLDSWLLIAINLSRTFESIERILKANLDLEIAIGVIADSIELESVFLGNETIIFLKNNIIGKYKKWYKDIYRNSLDKTFILLTTDAYKESYFKQVYSKPDPSAEYFLVKYEEFKKLMIQSHQYNLEKTLFNIQLDTGSHYSFIKKIGNDISLMMIFNIHNYTQFEFRMKDISMDVYFINEKGRQQFIDKIENSVNIPIYQFSPTGCSTELVLKGNFVDILRNFKENNENCYAIFLLKNIKMTLIGNADFFDNTGRDRFEWSIRKEIDHRLIVLKEEIRLD